MEIVKQMIFVFVLIGVNGFFAMSEIALISIKPVRLNTLAKKGNKSAERTIELVKNSNKFLSTIQIGITFAGFLASASTAVILADPLANLLKQIPVPFIVSQSSNIAVFLATVFIAYLSLIFGELVPKQIGLRWTSKIALIVSLPIQILGYLAYPLVKFLSLSTRVVLKLIPNINVAEKQQMTEEEIRQILSENKYIEEVEKYIIEGVFESGDSTVRNIMTPRTDIEHISIDASLDDLLGVISRTGYSRIPVIGESLDDVRGIIHVRDVIDFIYNNDEFKLSNIIHEAYVVPESKQSLVLLEELQKKGVHMAIVLDEYGGTSGIITLEDLLEEIVGEIHDRHNPDEIRIKKIEKGRYKIKGYTEIREVQARSPINVPFSSEYETIAGFVLYYLRHIPETGDSFTYNDWTITVTGVKRNRITEVEFVKN
ncbi:MAG: hemolysin family protein [Halanaerobiales bacterium]